MKYRILCTLFIGVFCTAFVHAQSITPIVIASSGGYYFISGTGSVSATVAEMTMIQTFESADGFITQGFQQPAETYLAIEENPDGFDVFPNPTNGKFSITIDANESGSVRIRLYNLLGLVVYSEVLEAAGGVNVFNLDISGFDAGVYLVEFTLHNLSGKSEIGTVKINLIND